MYSSTDLSNLLKRLTCEQKGTEFRALCKLCNNKSLFINPGKYKVAIAFCNNCGVENKEKVLQANNISADDLGPHLSVEEIDKIWQTITPNFHRVKDKSLRLQIAKSDLLHTCYTYLLKHQSCKLLPDHIEWLESRGLPLSKCEELLYASTPTSIEATKIAEELHKIIGEDIYNVPGFVKKDGKCNLRVNEAGIFHPTRNYEGEVNVVKIRKPKASKNDRLYALSSSSCDGPSSLVRCHIPLNVNKLVSQETVWITEGERKADVLFYKLNVATLGVPGSQNIKLAFEELKSNFSNCKRIVMAMDKDKAGDFATVNFRYEAEIRNLSYEFYYADWDTNENKS